MWPNEFGTRGVTLVISVSLWSRAGLREFRPNEKHIEVVQGCRCASPSCDWATLQVLSCVQLRSCYSSSRISDVDKLSAARFLLKVCLSLRSCFRPHSCIGNIATGASDSMVTQETALNNPESSVQSSGVNASNRVSLLPFNVQVRRRRIAACREGKGFVIELLTMEGAPQTTEYAGEP